MSNPPPDHNVTRDNQIPASGLGSNTGHGHVWARPDGMKARCGGPSMCSVCAGQLALINAPAQPSGDGQRTPEPIKEAAQKHSGTIHRTPEDDEDAFHNWNRDITDYAPSLWDAYCFGLTCREIDLSAMRIELGCMESENNALRARMASLEADLNNATKGLWSEWELERAKYKAKEIQGLFETANADLVTQLNRQLAAATERADALRRECENHKHNSVLLALWQKTLGTTQLSHAIARVEGTERDLKRTLLDLTTARAELAKWREAMRSIAIQKLSTEMNPTERDVADFETGYDMCVEEARRALAAGQGEGAGM